MENQIDLGLALGSSSRDAGANANSNLKITDTPTRPLSELVWSTQNGLTIKCAATCTKPPCCIFKDAPFLGSTLSHTDEHVGDVLHLSEMETCNKGKEKECMSSCETIPDANVAGTSKRPIIAHLLPVLLAKEPQNITEPFLEKIEETAENDVTLKNFEREEGHGESMNSGNNVMSTGNKRWRFEDRLIIQSKRIKKQSPPVVKQQDSSFMNWISNMVKGVKPIAIDDHKTLNLVSKGLGFQSVFQSLYSQRLQETKTRSKSKEIILFNKTVSYHVPYSWNQKACDNLWITRLSPRTHSTDNVSASLGLNTPRQIDKHTRSTCVQINENKNILLKEIASTSEKNKLLIEDKILKIPKQMFDTIKRLRLSRTDILKWMNSGLPIEDLEGYFLRLRLAKWEGGSGYYVACITGSKKSICVKIGGVECLVESRYISNCDFVQDEVVAWWRTSGETALLEDKLRSKLEERNKLGF